MVQAIGYSQQIKNCVATKAESCIAFAQWRSEGGTNMDTHLPIVKTGCKRRLGVSNAGGHPTSEIRKIKIL